MRRDCPCSNCFVLVGAGVSFQNVGSKERLLVAAGEKGASKIGLLAMWPTSSAKKRSFGLLPPVRAMGPEANLLVIDNNCYNYHVLF